MRSIPNAELAIPPDAPWSAKARPTWGRAWTGAQLLGAGINQGAVVLLDTSSELNAELERVDAAWTLQYQLANQGAGVIAGSPVFLRVTEFVGESQIVRALLPLRAAARKLPLQGRRVKVEAVRVPNPPLPADSVIQIGVAAAPYVEQPLEELGQFLANANPQTPVQIATIGAQGTVRRVYGGAIVATAASAEVPSWFQLFDSIGAPAPGTAPFLSVSADLLAPGVACDHDFFSQLWAVMSIDPQTFVVVPAGDTATANVRVDGWNGP